MYYDSILRKQLLVRCLREDKEKNSVQHYLNAQNYVKNLCEIRFTTEAPKIVQPKRVLILMHVPCDSIEK